jgi:hypothetical protein
VNDLERAIQQALASAGGEREANKAYLEFIKANFMIPIHKHSASEEPEVLYLTENEYAFLPVFSNKEYFDAWASDIGNAIDILTLSGVNLLKGLGGNVTVCLNIGSLIYKEFNPAELARMKGIVLKLFNS